MKPNMSSLFASALVGLALAAPVFAQGPGPGGPPPGQPQQFPGLGREGGASGTVASVDATARAITLAPQNGADGRVIKVGSDARITTQQTISVSDLKVGDQIGVQGIATGILVSQITVVPSPGLGSGAGGMRGGNGGGGNTGIAPQGFVSAMGTIKTLPTAADPHLTIKLESDVQVMLRVAAGAKIIKYTTVALSGIKAGDQIRARGDTGDDGTLTATTVGVNLTTGGGFGQGGFGGGGRNGRRGGQGGGGPGGGNGGPPPPGQ